MRKENAKVPVLSHYVIALVIILIIGAVVLFFDKSQNFAGAAFAANNTFDFSLSVKPSSGNIVQGQYITTNTTVRLLSGTTQTVYLSVIGCPPSALCQFYPSSGYPTYKSLFKITTSPYTPAGTYKMTVVGTGGGKTKTIKYTLTVLSAGCIRRVPTVTISPNNNNGNPGQQLTYTTTVKNNDYPACGNSTFSMSYSIPMTWSAYYSQNNLVISPGSSKATTFYLTSSANAVPEKYPFTNTATNNNALSYYDSGSAYYTVTNNTGNQTNTTGCGSLGLCQTTCGSGYVCSGAIPNGCGGTCVLNQTNSTFDFSVSTRPTSGSVVQGDSTNSITTVTLLSGPTENVDLSQTGCPASSTCTFTPSSGNPTYSSTFKMATTTSTPTGTYPITIKGTSNTKTRTTLYTLTVTAENSTNSTCTRSNPTVSISPPSKSGSAGQTLNYTTTVTNNDNNACGNSTFDMLASIPIAWSSSFNPTSLLISPGASKTTTFFITSNTNATKGNYTFTNTATNSAVPSYSGTGSAVYSIV